MAGKYSLRSFDPNRVTVTVAGTAIVGFADDKVMVERANNSWELIVGADGEATRVKSNDKSGSITINLQQSSPSNDFLSAIFAVDEAAASGVVPIVITDKSGTTVVGAPLAFIEKMLEASFSKNQNDRSWVFRCNNLNYYLGGNDSALAENEAADLASIRTAYNAANPSDPMKYPAE